jgi:hypothetical protein
MKKTIIIVILVVIVVLALVVTYTQMSSPVSGKDQGCTNSGGAVGTSQCCKSSGDFPNTCLIGACGCALTNSHEVKVCNCPAGKCFDGNKCI